MTKNIPGITHIFVSKVVKEFILFQCANLIMTTVKKKSNYQTDISLEGS